MKVALRIFFTGPKIEVTATGVASFRASLLYYNAPDRYEGNIDMYVRSTAWEKCETCPA
jgi:hypothetical protein